jgi:hypothetical protein
MPPCYRRLNLDEKCNKSVNIRSTLSKIHTCRVLIAVIVISSGYVADTCECGNEQSCSIKCGEILDLLRTGLLLRKDSVPWSR